MKHYPKVLRSLQMNETIIESEELEDKDEARAAMTENSNMSYLKRNTPILFSTNRGLHLRITTTNIPTIEVQTMASKPSSTSTSRVTSVVDSTYNITFCDLERWVYI